MEKTEEASVKVGILEYKERVVGLHEIVNDILSTLTLREQCVLRNRFRIEKDSVLGSDLKKLSKHFEVSCEKIRRIEDEALRKVFRLLLDIAKV